MVLTLTWAAQHCKGHNSRIIREFVHFSAPILDSGSQPLPARSERLRDAGLVGRPAVRRLLRFRAEKTVGVPGAASIGGDATGSGVRQLRREAVYGSAGVVPGGDAPGPEVDPDLPEGQREGVRIDPQLGDEVQVVVVEGRRDRSQVVHRTVGAVVPPDDLDLAGQVDAGLADAGAIAGHLAGKIGRHGAIPACQRGGGILRSTTPRRGIRKRADAPVREVRVHQRAVRQDEWTTQQARQKKDDTETKVLTIQHSSILFHGTLRGNSLPCQVFTEAARVYTVHGLV